jgi:uncharacterized paraquat-inducible protein A
MIVITTPLGAIGLLAIAYLSSLFANFSRRLSTVTKMANHYRWFLMADIFIVITALSQIMRSTATLAPDLAPHVLLTPWFSLVTFHIPLVIGVTIDLVLVRYYWGWILREKIK